MYHIRLARNTAWAAQTIHTFRLCPGVTTVNFINKKQNNLNVHRTFSLHSTVESIVQTQTGFFRALSESTPVAYSQEFLLNVHSSTGLPWWASIIVTTVLLRACVTTPFAIYQNYIIAKVENLQLEMPKIVEELKKEMDLAVHHFKLSEPQAKYLYNKSLKKQWNNLIVRDNCHPFKASLLLWVQLPMWVCVSVSLRNLVYMLPNMDALAQMTYFELSLGGLAWIPNLTVPDASWILPVFLGLVNLSIIELQIMTKLKEPTKYQRYFSNLFRIISVVLVPISATVPSCMCLYWTTSSVYGLVQNLVLLSPKVKRLTGVPKCASELERPYTHVVNTIKQRLNGGKVKENVT